ncbi:MAG: YaaR family protein [Spirochaetaceae bacterium]
MEKIRSTGAGGFLRYGKSSSKKEAASLQEPHTLSFSELWESESKEDAPGIERKFPLDVEADIEELVDDVHEQGESLKERPTYENIRNYKESVKKFLSYVVSRTLEVETREGGKFNPLKKQRKYTLVKIIDEKLEHLAAGIMQNQRAQLDILKKVEEINGLVVDLLS